MSVDSVVANVFNYVHEVICSRNTLVGVALSVVRVERLAEVTRAALHAAVPLKTTALLVRGTGLGRGKGEDQCAGPLGGGDEVGAGVGGNHAGEDGGVDDEQVVSAVDLGVQVDDGGAARATVVLAELVGTDPVVGAAVAP